MKFIGTVKKIGDIEEVGKNSIKKIVVVFEEVGDRDWKQSVAVTFLKDKVAMIDNIAIGMLVEVSFSIQSNEYNDKDYNNINAYGIKTADGQPLKEKEEEEDMPF